MPANINQIFSVAGRTTFSNFDGDGGAAGPLKTANNVYDASGTVLTFFTAGANGSRVETVRARANGTNAATVWRVWINDGTSGAAHSVLWAELSLPATTASAVAALPDFYLGPPFFPLVLPANYRLQCALGTTVTGGYFISAQGGDY